MVRSLCLCHTYLLCRRLRVSCVRVFVHFFPSLKPRTVLVVKDAALRHLPDKVLFGQVSNMSWLLTMLSSQHFAGETPSPPARNLLAFDFPANALGHYIPKLAKLGRILQTSSPLLLYAEQAKIWCTHT